MMADGIRIIVVDDHNLFRAGVIELLQTVADFRVIAEGSSGIDALTLSRDHQPDVVILDVEMHGPGARATIHHILEVSPATRIVVLTMHDDPELVHELFRAGAAGYVLKSAGRTELIAAINAAARNEESVVLAVSRTTVMTLGRNDSSPSGLLSPRETEVLGLLAQGRTNREIADALFMSTGTVKRHLSNIYTKLNTASRLGAVQRAVQLGIVPSATPSPSGGLPETAG